VRGGDLEVKSILASRVAELNLTSDGAQLEALRRDFAELSVPKLYQFHQSCTLETNYSMR